MPGQADQKRTKKLSDIIESGLSLPRTRSQHAAANCPIFVLNDDCLLEICSYLPAMELCAVKDTCRRFSAIADYAAKLRYQQVAEFECVPNDENQKDLAIFMQHFGKYVGGKIVVKTELAFDAKKMWLLLKHCGALKELELLGVNVSGLPIYQMKKMLQNLEVLQFKKCKGEDSDYARIINACVNLRSLTAFINLNGASDKLFPLIAHRASNIEELFYAPINSDPNSFVENMAKLRRLKKLNLLFISCNNHRIAKAIDALAERNTLQFLLLREILPDKDLGRALDKFTNLEICFIQTEFEMSEDVLNCFGKFIADGKMCGLFNYKYCPKNQVN